MNDFAAVVSAMTGCRHQKAENGVEFTGKIATVPVYIDNQHVCV